MSVSPTIHGACLCAAVRYELAARPSYVVHCHCTMCRRAHGAGVVTWASFPAEALHVTQGAERVACYRSSEHATRRFCSRCGSPLFFESTHAPGQLDVSLATIATPLAEPPVMHVWWNERVPWLVLGDELPRRNDPYAADDPPTAG